MHLGKKAPGCTFIRSCMSAMIFFVFTLPLLVSNQAQLSSQLANMQTTINKVQQIPHVDPFTVELLPGED